MAWADLATSAHRVAVGVFDHTPAAQVGLVIIATGTVLPFPAVFDEAGVKVDHETGATISTNAPMLGATIADLPAQPNNKLHRVRVGAAEYSIVEVARDGVAGVTLHLKAYAP
jgi:hypothetical protein